MTLEAFIKALTNQNTVVTVQDGNKQELIKFYAAGYEQLLTDLLSKNVENFTVTSAQAVTVVLEAEISA